jgi:hypothetical protein
MILRFYDKNKNVIGSRIYIKGKHQRKTLFSYCRDVIRDYFNKKVKYITLTNN